MQYVGGKQKSGGHRIAAMIGLFAVRQQTRNIVEPFCGGLSVTYRLRVLDVHARDACVPLIALYKALQLGWEPPAEVSRETWERYKAMKDDPDRQGDPMLAFVGFGCSRSGDWFSSFIADYKYTNRRVPAATAARDSLRKKIEACAAVDFVAGDYTNAPVRGVWYCDIPYVDSLGYPAVGPFDHAAFWTFAAEVSQKVPVLVSERIAPEGWSAVDEWSVQQRLTTVSGTRRMERLFVHERWAR